MSGTITMTGEEYDALHAEAEAPWSTYSALVDKLGIDTEKAKTADGKPSDVIVSYVEALRAENAKLRTALAEQVERQEAVAEYQQLSIYGNWDRVDKAVYDLGKLGDTPEKFRALYTTPQPGPDVRALVEAVNGVKLTPSDMRHWGRGSVWWNNAVEACLDAINNAHRQAQQGDSNDT